MAEILNPFTGEPMQVPDPPAPPEPVDLTVAVSSGLAFPHASGGTLRIDTHRLALRLGIDAIHRTPEFGADFIDLSKTIADESGDLHVLRTTISAMDVLHALRGRTGCSEDRFLASGRELEAFVETLQVGTDDRDVWHFHWTEGDGAPDDQGAVTISQKYFGAKVDVWLDTRTSGTRFVGVAWLHTDVEVSGSAFVDEIPSGTPIHFELPTSLVLWQSSYPRVADLADGAGPGPAHPQPLVFAATGERGAAQAGVRVVAPDG